MTILRARTGYSVFVNEYCLSYIVIYCIRALSADCLNDCVHRSSIYLLRELVCLSKYSRLSHGVYTHTQTLKHTLARYVSIYIKYCVHILYTFLVACLLSPIQLFGRDSHAKQRVHPYVMSPFIHRRLIVLKELFKKIGIPSSTKLLLLPLDQHKCSSIPAGFDSTPSRQAYHSSQLPQSLFYILLRKRFVK